MQLCVDIGNSRIKYAVFDRRKRLRYAIALSVEEIAQHCAHYPIKRAIVSSVRQGDDVISVLSEICPVVVLTHQTPLPIRSIYETPETLGRDRIAVAVAAHAMYPKRHNLIVDAGTCMTMDVIDAHGVYRGGNIAPGLEMRIRAMHEFTARLPLVVKRLPPSVLGLSTETALQNGAILGAAMEIEALARRLRDKYPRINIILTGGDAQILADNVKRKIFVVPDLVLIGLNEILQSNA